jgi:sulfite reductase alpha subunit-like flavoprotein
MAFLGRYAAVVVIVSTAGQGDFPPTVVAFWNMLRRLDLPRLPSTPIAVFGCGDSSYERYNFAAKKVFKRLVQLGGVPMVPRGDGDDAHDAGLDGAFVPFLQELVPALDALGLRPEGEAPLTWEEVNAPAYRVSVVPAAEVDEALARAADEALAGTANSWPFGTGIGGTARIVHNERLTTPGWRQDVRRVDVDVSSILPESYHVGDALSLWPENDEETVVKFLTEYPGLHPDDVLVSCEPRIASDGTPRLAAPLPIRLRVLFSRYLDLFGGPPKRRFFSLLADYATIELQASRLRELGSPEGLADLLDYSTREWRSPAEHFQQFPSARPPLDRLLDLVPPIHPRPFSITSSPIVSPGVASLTVAVVERRLPSGRRVHRGLCSWWLTKQPSTVRAGLHRDSPALYRLLANEAAPLLLVGPGTGSALPLAIIETRVALARAGTPVGPVIFFFGCRHADQDDLWSTRLSTLLKEQASGSFNVLTAYRVAHSRDQLKRRYVQHAMRDDADLLRTFLAKPDAGVLICGAAGKMPRQVKEALAEIIGEESWKAMNRGGRVVCETWS